MNKMWLLVLMSGLTHFSVGMTSEKLRDYCAASYGFNAESGVVTNPVAQLQKDRIYGRYDSSEGRMVYVATTGEGVLDPSPIVDKVIINCEMVGITIDPNFSPYCVRVGSKFERLKKDDERLKDGVNKGVTRALRMLQDGKIKWVRVSDGPKIPDR